MSQLKSDNSGFSPSKKWLLFYVFLGLLILDRIITLVYFGFVYSDIDQMVIWNGAFDYANGIFHEPFFYGQPFNYMLEAFLAVPLLWIHVPINIALPIITSVISLLPFIVLALFFIKKEKCFWAYLCLAFPVLLPLQYNFITTISRGFVQAHFFVPLLFIPLLNPQSKKSVTFLYMAFAICFISNQSSLLLTLPIALLVYTYHFKSISFYLKSLFAIPFFILDYYAKCFYKIHPGRVLHELVGLKFDSHTFFLSFKNANLFENLFPFFSGWGIVYPFLFLLLAVVALTKSMMKEFLFIISILILLLITFAIPKVQEFVPHAGIFFTSSRLYLYLPILLIIASYLVFQKFLFTKTPFYFLLVLCALSFIAKNFKIQQSVQQTISSTIFPVARNHDLISRAKQLKSLAVKYNLDLIVHTTSASWNYVFDSYAFNPLTKGDSRQSEKTISVNIDGDRRAWLYPDATNCKQILLNGIKIDTTLLKKFNYEIISPSQIIIKNNTLNTPDLFSKLNLKFGNTIL